MPSLLPKADTVSNYSNCSHYSDCHIAHHRMDIVDCHIPDWPMNFDEFHCSDRCTTEVPDDRDVDHVDCYCKVAAVDVVDDADGNSFDDLVHAVPADDPIKWQPIETFRWHWLLWLYATYSNGGYWMEALALP